MWFLVNLCIVDSYVVYKETLSTHGRKPKTHLQYRMVLTEQLIGGFSSRKRKAGPAAPVVEIGNLAGHNLVKAKSKLTCKNCSQLGRKTAAGRYKQTTFKCQSCDVSLCKDGCLVEYHTRHATK